MSTAPVFAIIRAMKKQLAAVFLVCRLFWELFMISLLVVGGGYAIIVVADGVFARLGWTEEGELLEKLPVFQSVPGIIATHVAVYVGNKMAGRLGAAVGVAAVALPSVAIFTAVSAGYASLPLRSPWLSGAFTGLRAAIAGIVAAALIRGWRRSVDSVFAYAVLVTSVIAIAALDVPVPFVILAAMALGVAVPERCGAEASKRFRSSWLPLLLFLKYGALCFGGGFVLVPMYIQDFVGPDAPFLNIGQEEFANLMALTQMTPGPIGVNGATFFGFRFAGVPGAIAASALILLPGSVALWFVLRSMERFSGSRIVRGIMRGARPASAALMICAMRSFVSTSPVALAVAIFAAVAMVRFRPNVVILVFTCAAAAAAAGMICG